MSDRKKQLRIRDGGAIIEIGRAGENCFRTVEFDVSDWAESGAKYAMVYSRPDGTTYLLSAKVRGNILSWTPEAYDLEHCGFGSLEIRAYIGEVVGKSEIFKVNIAESIRTDETEPGISRPDWVNDIIDKVVIDSVEQTVTSDSDGGTNVLTVTLTDGSTTDFYVKNGTKGNKGDSGEQGQKGEDGYTPQRGIDYWTDADKAEIVKSVDAFTKEETMTEIEVYVSNELDVLYRIIDPHIADENNQHKVTAEQIGALTTDSLNDEMGKYIPQLENAIGALENGKADKTDVYTKEETVGVAYNTFVASMDYQDLLRDVRILQEKVGDIDAALDELHSYATTLAGGVE